MFDRLVILVILPTFIAASALRSGDSKMAKTTFADLEKVFVAPASQISEVEALAMSDSFTSYPYGYGITYASTGCGGTIECKSENSSTLLLIDDFSYLQQRS